MTGIDAVLPKRTNKKSPQKYNSKAYRLIKMKCSSFHIKIIQKKGSKWGMIEQKPKETRKHVIKWYTYQYVCEM